MTTLIMLASHRSQSCILVRLSSRPNHRQAFVAFGQARSDALQHPCTTQVESIQMRQLWVTGIRGYHWLHPRAFSRRGNLRQKSAEPMGHLWTRQHTPHEVGFAETRRKEIFTRRLVCEWTISVPEVKLPGLRYQEVGKLRIPHGASIVEH